MKRKLLYLLSIALLAACSAPKYSYNFGTYDYNAGKRKAAPVEATAQQKVVQGQRQEELTAPAEMTASVEATSSRVEKSIESSALTNVQTSLKAKYELMSKSEKKEFRKEVLHAAKNYSKAMKRGDHIAAEKAVQALDHDLKLAIIFGAVGLAITLFGGLGYAFYVVGVIAFLIGLVFFIKWVLRQ